jgi:hypothetical protein
MKTIITLLALVLVTGLAMGQNQSTPMRPWVEQVNLNDSVCTSATYAASQLDTTVAYRLDTYADAFLVFTSTDSISMSVKYAGSIDGVTFEDQQTLIDSITTTGGGAAAANGIIQSLLVPKKLSGFQAVKFIFSFHANLNGVTTPKYSAILVKR